MIHSKMKNEFNRLKALPEIGSFDAIMDFTDKLNIKNDNDTLEFHYSLLKDKESLDLYYDVRAAFMDRNKETVKPFLLNKLKAEKDDELRADALQIAGTLKIEDALPYAREFIKSDIRDFRYRGIIVTGWLGNKSDISLLADRLFNEPDIQLRGYAATALRQLWSRLPETKDEIVKLLHKALSTEEEELATQLIIIVLQDLLKKKFGLRENIDEDVITGDVWKAKDKALSVLSKLNKNV